MRKYLILPALLLSLAASSQSFTNALKIPYTISGNNFSLNIHDSTTQFYSGHSTNTRGYNNMSYLGPTLIFEKDSVVSLTIKNRLTEETTVHWHGLHVPAKWDGGPMNLILAGATWSPQFKIMNEASTLWYHAHAHMKTLDQVLKGLAGIIIVRDTIEKKLNLPRSYGTDDIPLVLQDREFDGSFQFQNPPLGSIMMVNGTITPYLNCPSQVVRLRVLNGSTERSYMIGFSDDRNFSQIGIDGGLLEVPVTMNRLRISPGERAELLLDLTSATLNDSVFMMNYGTELGTGVSGGFSNGPGGGVGPLDSTDTKILKIVFAASTASPVTSIPSTLKTIDYLDTNLVSRTRMKIITDPLFPGGPFTIDGVDYDMAVINDTVLLGATEIWEIKNNSRLLHPMHIHDVSFNIISRNGIQALGNEKGWKDVVEVEADETVRLVARFDDFADPDYAYMFHCHLLDHEDHGMMHQFIVLDPSVTGISKPALPTFVVFPNPATDKINIEYPLADDFEVEISDLSGRLVAKYKNLKEINISAIPAGLYFIRISDTGQVISAKFVKH